MLGVVANPPWADFFNKLNIPPKHRLLSQRVSPRQTKYGRIVAGIHHTIASKAIILTMLRYNYVKHSGIFQGPKHNRRVLNAVAVISKTNGAGLGPTGDSKYIPILEAWAEIDYKKVRQKIGWVIRRLKREAAGEGPLEE